MEKKISGAVRIATWFQSGLIRPVLFKGMAGTYGSFFALPFCLLVLVTARKFGTTIGNDMALYFYATVCLGIFFSGMLVVPTAELELGPRTDWKGKTKERDQNEIVIDEVFGMLISCIPLLFVAELTVMHFIIAFAFFRFFDIVKIPPTRFFDRMKNAFGVMADDLIAGIYAAIILHLYIRYIL